MGLKIIKGNIFTSQCQTLVNPVNCVGVMGAGIALEFRLRYRDMFYRYQELCESKQLDIGKLWIYKSPDRWILNFPTKRDWKQPTKLDYLVSGLDKFLATYQERGVTSIAFPLLGAGRGGVDPAVSLKLMEQYLSALTIDVEIYQYDPAAKDDLFDRTKSLVLSMSVDELAQATGLRKNYVQKVLEAFNQPNICQLNQLLQVKGVGETTVEKVFDFALGQTN